MENGFVRVPLTRGYFALVDAADYDKVQPYKWRVLVCKCGLKYAVSGEHQSGTFKYMHCFLLGVRRGVDHQNGDGLDNRRSNIRLCSHIQNMQNRVKPCHGKNHFKGVKRHLYCGAGMCRRRRIRQWQANITVDKRTVSLGYFLTEEEAARAYDAAAFKYFGPFARPNFAYQQAIAA